MKVNCLEAVGALAALLLGGCSGFGQKVAQSDGLLELASALSGREEVTLIPVERLSRSPGRVDTAHVRRDADGLYVSGSVEKLGPGWVSAAWSHLDVLVLDAERRVRRGVAASFFPSEVPATQRGIRGRARYFARLPALIPSAATIIVAFHNVPKSRCRLEAAALN